MLDIFDENNEFINNFKENIESKGIPQSSVNKIITKISKISKYINNTNLNLLIIGQIQSGKTNCFLGIISLVFDQKIDLAFIIGGTDKEIYKQNLNRTKELFEDNCVSRHCYIFSKDDFKNKNICEDIIAKIKNNIRIIIVCNKHSGNIAMWSKVLNSVKDKIKSSLIIDDEGDTFSFNSHYKDVKGEYTPTYSAICQLKNVFLNKTTFISVTATPYAHFLLKSNDKLRPHYSFLIEKDSGYIGSQFFIENENIVRNDILNIISDNEKNDFDEKKYLGPAFKDAVLCYLIRSTFFFFYYKNNKKIKKPFAKMLINPGRLNIQHQEACDDLHAEIKNFIKKMNSNDSVFMNKIKNVYNEFIVYFKNDTLISNPDKFLDEFKKLLNNIDLNLEIKIVASNGKYKPSDKIWNIFIGCAKLSRGITINNLICTYIIHRPKDKGNCDTISQAQRWLGYREEYKFFLSLYCTADLLKDFSSIYSMNEKVYDCIYELDEKEINWSNTKFKLTINRDDYKLLPSRSSINKFLIENSINQNETNRAYFINEKWDASATEKNRSQEIEEIWIFLDQRIKSAEINPFKLENELEINERGFTSILFNNILDLKNKIGHNLFSKFYDYLGISYNLFEKICKRNENAKIVVSLMKVRRSDHSIDNRFRTLCGNKIISIPSGKSGKYVGDKYWTKKTKDKYMYIQIFPIKITKNDQKIILYKMGLLQYIEKKNEVGDNTYYVSVDDVLENF